MRILLQTPMPLERRVVHGEPAAVCFDLGLGCVQDSETAFELYELAAREGVGAGSPPLAALACMWRACVVCKRVCCRCSQSCLVGCMRVTDGRGADEADAVSTCLPAILVSLPIACVSPSLLLTRQLNTTLASPTEMAPASLEISTRPSSFSNWPPQRPTRRLQCVCRRRALQRACC